MNTEYPPDRIKINIHTPAPHQQSGFNQTEYKANIIDNDGKEIGYFWIRTDVGSRVTPRIIRSGVVNIMNIEVDEDWQGRGLARGMAAKVAKQIEDLSPPWLDKHTLFYIPGDSSDGFWEHIGFVENPNYDIEDHASYGHELMINWNKFLEWVGPLPPTSSSGTGSSPVKKRHTQQRMTTRAENKRQRTNTGRVRKKRRKKSKFRKKKTRGGKSRRRRRRQTRR